MQVDGAAQEVSTIARRKRLNVLVAIVAVVVIGAMVALLVWAAPLATSGVEAQDASPNAWAGSAVIHDDAGNVNRYSYPLPPGKGAQLNAGAGSAVVHDDAAKVHR
jgi:hypothetical protein